MIMKISQPLDLLTNETMRLSPNIVRQARLVLKYLPLLLGPNKSLDAAKQELTWIKRELPKLKWVDAIIRRASHEPLQYILGTQPFGELDIKCKPGVLIPRWETEEWTMNLGRYIIRKKPQFPLRILDVCTGTGCIPLLLNKILLDHKTPHFIDAFDVSPAAISLSNENKALHGLLVNFFLQDLFQWDLQKGSYDVIVSNPPYIPAADLTSHEVETSVRLYEPELALLGDLEFYTALINKVIIPSDCKLFVFELGYQKQVDHVNGLLSGDWITKAVLDSAGNLRCVVGVLKSGEFNDIMTSM